MKTDARTPITLAVAGDWHGDSGWALRCLRHLHTLGVREIFHLGDFGIWPGKGGRNYLRAIEDQLAALSIVLFVTPGNHEDYQQISELPAVDLGHEIGPVQWITDHIAILPRNHRFTRGGWSIASVGGAPSIDFEGRIEGRNWWADEMITGSEVEAAIEAGPADVLLAHDSPDAQFAARKVAHILQTNPHGYSRTALSYCALGRARITTIFEALEPEVVAHGHYHVRDERRFRVPGWKHDTVTVSTDCDGSWSGNVALLRIGARGGHAVDWVEIPRPAG